MKLLILIVGLFFFGCHSQTSNRDSLHLVVKSIDSTSNNYILHLEKNNKKVIVPIFKNCNSKKDYLSKIKIGESYRFILVKEVNYAKTQPGFLSQMVDGVEIWNSNMKQTTYYTDCENMCGLYIH